MAVEERWDIFDGVGFWSGLVWILGIRNMGRYNMVLWEGFGDCIGIGISDGLERRDTFHLAKTIDSVREGHPSLLYYVDSHR